MNLWSRFLPVLVLGFSLAMVSAADRKSQWDKVDEAVRQGLPRSAITNLEPIIAGATADQAWGELARAVARKIALTGNIEGGKAEERITRLEKEITNAPPAIKPIYQAILAQWYWQYFQQNRWRFMQRTATAEAPGKDFTTWDLRRLFAEIDRVYGDALAAAPQLKQTPIATLDALIEKGNRPDAYRPTLFDFVAQEALTFHTSGERAGSQAEDAFEVPAESPLLGSLEEFLAWKPDTTDTQSPKLRAIQLYQELLRFHAADADPTARIDADLARLHWGYNVAYGEARATRYAAALKAFIDRWADHEVGALALDYLAELRHGQGEWVEAHQLATRAINGHPKSPGAARAWNLRNQIEAREATIATEKVWNEPLSGISVRYRNVTNLYFRAIAWDWNDFLDRRRSRPEWLNDRDRAEVLARKPVVEWSTNLAPTTDFKQRVADLPAPKLGPGYYFIIASQRPDFADLNNLVSMTDVWVSDLALVVVTGNGTVDGFVLHAPSGEPMPNAEISAWFLDAQGNRELNGPSQRTDTNGWFSLKPRDGRGLLIRASAVARPFPLPANYNGPVEMHTVATAGDQNSWPRERERASEQTIFFTDRSLYRPGQTIQYKGILLRVDQDKDDYKVLPNRTVTVVFTDPNGKEVARQTRPANDFGSISGSFTAPRDRLAGGYTIAINTGPRGSTGFNVEEYKRPKFQVTVAAPAVAPKLNGEVAMTGKAEAYTGAAIDGAEVKWHVVREVRWPVWWLLGSRGGHLGESQEIAHGTARTGADGTFKIAFVARPDPKVDPKSEASFRYRVTADVTDAAGETRSGDRSVNVGFTALEAEVSVADWQTDERAVEVKISTTTLDGEGQRAEGVVRIHRLKAPERVQRPRLGGNVFEDADSDGKPDEDLGTPNNWPLGEVAVERGFTTDGEGVATLSALLAPGAYRAVLQTQDRFGAKVSARDQFFVIQPNAERFGIKVAHHVAAPKWSLEPGAEFSAVWGTGYDTGRAFIEVEHRGKMLQRFWTRPGATQYQLKQAVTEAMRGGFTVHVTQVRENRAFLDSRHVDVPWSNKELDLKWERMVSKLQPGQKETWTLVVQPRATNQAERLAAEMVATLYDASLDQFNPHNWPHRFNIFRTDGSQRVAHFVNGEQFFRHVFGQWVVESRDGSISYRHFPSDIVSWNWGFAYASRRMSFRGAGVAGGGMVADAMPMPMESMAAMAVAAPAAPAPAAGAVMEKAALGDARAVPARLAADAGPPGGVAPAGPAVDLSQVSARRNLNETAFFFPQATTDSNGVVRLAFSMPEALTQWRFLGFAHDTKVRSGFLSGEAVTAKDIMVQPNPPRFLREGDEIEFTVKVSNQSATRQAGRVKLTFAEAWNEASADAALGNTSPEQSFDIPSRESRSFSWRLRVPDGMGFLTYRAVAGTGRQSDGEEGAVPVLPRRVFLTESLPLPIRGNQAGGEVTRQFEFAKLLQSGASDTLRHQSLTVQVVSQPAWYAVLALPYLMEYPHECTEQTFNRYYANNLARHIAKSDPKIHRVFDQWRNTPALDSPLEKNADLKSVALEETPWYRQGRNESEARRNVGVLFDDNRLDSETARTLGQLVEMQLPDGAWPWFPGGRANDFITLYITTGFGRLRHLGVPIDPTAALRSLARLDNWMQAQYVEIMKGKNPESYVPSSTDALYLYGRSFFLKDRAISRNHQTAIDFYLARAREHWLRTGNRQSQGYLALALKRWGGEANLEAARGIVRSLKERSVTNEEMGRFWRDTELSWWWYRAPIETQAVMIEAFDEVAGDADAVEDCKVWLIKQKQTQDWKTTKATADAVYALLLRGANVLSSDKLLQVALAGEVVKPAADPRRPEVSPVEAGTGFYERRFTAADIKPGQGRITLTKTDPGVAWASVHWQYFEDISKVTPHTGTPLKLKKSLFTKIDTKQGKQLVPVSGPVAVGDELVVRIELRVDRDMEYIHLKDHRGSGTEPVNVLSRYRYQDGLGYYETTRDTASHFFIDYLPKGVYVFEYSTRVQLRGKYQTGVAEIQSLYAPEFNSHSESLPLEVR